MCRLFLLKFPTFIYISNKYKKFHKNLCPNSNEILGVRVPVLRNLAKEIIKESYRITKKDATVIFSFNYYIDPHKMEERGFRVDGSLIYIDGVLRLNSVSDSDWTCELKKYYQDIELKYFSWPGEKEKTRRLFILKK